MQHDVRTIAHTAISARDLLRAAQERLGVLQQACSERVQQVHAAKQSWINHTAAAYTAIDLAEQQLIALIKAKMQDLRHKTYLRHEVLLLLLLPLLIDTVSVYCVQR